MSDANTEALKTLAMDLWQEDVTVHFARRLDKIIEALSPPAAPEDGVSFCGGMQTITYVSPQMEYDFDDTPPSVSVNVESERDLDAWIVEVVRKAALLCVHPEAATTIDIGRAIVAALQPAVQNAEFQRMVERGTEAWKDVPDNWLEELRGNDTPAPSPSSQGGE